MSSQSPGQKSAFSWLQDRDFGDLIFHQGLEHAGVLFFRLPGADLKTKVDHLNTVLTDHADELSAGEFLVVTAGQIRVAGRPPIK